MFIFFYKYIVDIFVWHALKLASIQAKQNEFSGQVTL